MSSLGQLTCCIGWEVFNAAILAGRLLYQLVVPLHAKVGEICPATMAGVGKF